MGVFRLPFPIKMKKPSGPPEWLSERLIVVYDPHPDPSEWHLIDRGEWLGSFQEPEAMDRVRALGVSETKARELFGYARYWECAALAYLEPDPRKQEMIAPDERGWNLESVMPPREWRRVAISWGWIDMGFGNFKNPKA